jgi:hypothetical protein
MNRATLLIAALALAACGKSTITADEARSAVQSAEGIAMAPPGASAPSVEAQPGVAYSVAGDPSEFRRHTRNLALAFNGTTAFALGLVRLVVAFPPTECKDHTCTWGPWSNALEPVEWRLTVTKVADGQFEYAFAGHLRASPGAAWVDVMTGTAFPKSRFRGHGTFVIDGDAARLLDPTRDPGRLSVTWSNEAGLSIEATFERLVDHNNADHQINARYSYADSATAGDLRLAFRDMTANAQGQLKIHSRWVIPTGEGRADAMVSNGVLTFTASECWSGAAAGFRVVYWTSNDPAQPPSGDPAQCAYGQAADIPAFDAP